MHMCVHSFALNVNIGALSGVLMLRQPVLLWGKRGLETGRLDVDDRKECQTGLWLGGGGRERVA